MRTLLSLLVVVLLLAQGAPGSAAQEPDGVTTLTGTLTLTSPNLLETISEPYILLADMTAYVERDRELTLPLRSQIVAPLEGDLAEGASYAIHLPIAPQGSVNDVGHGRGGTGVQLYSVEFAANIFGDPFLGPTEFTGWGEALSSLEVELGSGEVIGGQVVIWADDDRQVVPTGLGPDGRFLTTDDPVGPVPAGWTLLDLNAEPFGQIRTPEAEVTIVEGDDGFTDYGDLTFTEAFDRLLADLEARYVFTELKGIDWEHLRATYRPRVEQAERDDDLGAFRTAMFELGLEFNDGHVSSQPPRQYFAERIGGGLGLSVARTERGEIIAVSITPGMPADRAGIEPGAIITAWDGVPTRRAVADVPILFSVSTDVDRLLQRLELLTRGPLGEQVSVTFENPDSDEETVELTFVWDIDIPEPVDDPTLDASQLNTSVLPIDARTLPSGLGYIRVSTFQADPLLMSTAWNRALRTFQDEEVPGLIIDVRDNGGGQGSSARYLAGSFAPEPFVLYREEIINAEGESVTTDTRQVTPSPVQWELPVAVLINSSCASACEIFTAAMVESGNSLIVGYTPTAGVEGGVYFWNLPGDVPFQATLVRLVRDGEIFLEGTGVPPTVRVPATVENLLDPGDEVLRTAEEALEPHLRER